MKYRVWALSLGVICLLQRPVSAEPRPEFALDEPVYGTGRVSGALSSVSVEVNGLTSTLNVVLQANYPLLGNVLSLLSNLAGSTNGALNSMFGPLSFLTTSNAAAGFSAFPAVLDQIDSVKGFIGEGVPFFAGSLGELVGHFLPDQLDDAYTRIDEGLDELRAAVSDLAAAVQPLLGSGEPSEESCVSPYVRPRLVYRVAYAVRQLRGYLPLLAYIIATTTENLHTADVFLVRLAAEATEVQDVTQYVEYYEVGVEPLEPAVAFALSTVRTGLSAVAATLPTFTNVQSVSSFATLQSALATYLTVLDQEPVAADGFLAALSAVALDLGDLLAGDEDVPTVGNSGVVEALVVTLVSNGPFSRYCFQKYSELLFGFADEGLNGVEECIDRELDRLYYMRDTMVRLVRALAYDFQDLPDELAVCDGLRRSTQRERCVDRLAARYGDLAANYDHKFDLVYDVGVTEVTASKYRLYACVDALQFRLIDESNYQLKRKIRRCAKHGPYHEEDCSDEAPPMMIP